MNFNTVKGKFRNKGRERTRRNTTIVDSVKNKITGDDMKLNFQEDINKNSKDDNNVNKNFLEDINKNSKDDTNVTKNVQGEKLESDPAECHEKETNRAEPSAEVKVSTKCEKSQHRRKQLQKPDSQLIIQQQIQQQPNVGNNNMNTNRIPVSTWQNSMLRNTIDYSHFDNLLRSNLLKPKIFSRYNRGDVNSMSLENRFTDLRCSLVPISKAHEQNDYQKSLKEIRKLRTISETSYMEGDSFIKLQRHLFLAETSKAFMTSRLATLRRTPARIIVPMAELSSSTESFSTTEHGESTLQLINDAVRIDGVEIGAKRFDPYHAQCRHICRRCYFLAQTIYPPNVNQKMMKPIRPRSPSVSKSQRKKFGLRFSAK